MGVIKFFSSDSRDNTDCNGSKVIEKIVRVRSTPDPSRFEIRRKKTVNGYPIYWVRYDDVENYEGNKILMYPKYFNTDLIKNKMDPHFFTDGDSPIARFEPTAFGWKLAVLLADSL